jgi:hypothetical protein
MPDAMMNGGYAPYLAQAFTPQGVPGGMFGSSIGNIPGTIFSNPASAANYGVPPFGVMPQLAQPQVQPYTGWQQQPAPANSFAQFAGPVGSAVGWPYPHQLGQSFNQPYSGWQQLSPQPLMGNQLAPSAAPAGTGLGWPYGQLQSPQQTGQIATSQLGPSLGQPTGTWQEPLALAQLLRQYAVPISAVVASPYGQAHIAQHIMQTAEMLTRVLPLVGAPQLIPVAHLLGQCAVPISAAIASPYGQAHIAQNIAQTAEMLERVLPIVGGQQMTRFYGQPSTGWQQPLVPQLPVTSLLGQHQQYLPQAVGAPLGGVMGGQFGPGQLGPFANQPGDMLGRIPPFLAQQGLAGQSYGMART